MCDHTNVTDDQEKRLREQIASLDGHKSHALASVYAALWLQILAVTASRKEYTILMEYSEKPILECVEAVDRAFDSEFEKKSISLESARAALMPVLDFVSTYPNTKKIAGAAHLFSPHPSIKDGMGITPKGLELMNDLVRPFLVRMNQIEKHKWGPALPENTYQAVETDAFVDRFISFAVDNASCASTDEFLASVRSRFIARSMKKRALYAWNNKSFVKTKDFYLCMREVEPERINGIHHIGSTPVLVALEDPKENTLLKQIISVAILVSFLDTLYFDDTFGDVAPARSQLRKIKSKEAIGHFCGDYVVIGSNGLTTSTGTGWEGIKGCVLLYTSHHAPSLHDYLAGHRDKYRETTVEDELSASTCF